MLFCFHLGQRNVYFVQWKEAKMSKASQPLPIGQDVSYEPYWKCDVQLKRLFFLSTTGNMSKEFAKSTPKAASYGCHGVFGFMRKQCKQTVAVESNGSEARLQMATPLNLPTGAPTDVVRMSKSTAWRGGIHSDLPSDTFSSSSSHILHLFKDMPLPLRIQQSYELFIDSHLLTIYHQSSVQGINVCVENGVLFLHVICD